MAFLFRYKHSRGNIAQSISISSSVCLISLTRSVKTDVFSSMFKLITKSLG